jgi:hypothetical protein
MYPGMTDNILNPALFARGFKIIFTTTHTNFVGKFLSQGTNSGLDGIKHV